MKEWLKGAAAKADDWITNSSFLKKAQTALGHGWQGIAGANGIANSKLGIAGIAAGMFGMGIASEAGKDIENTDVRDIQQLKTLKHALGVVPTTMAGAIGGSVLGGIAGSISKMKRPGIASGIGAALGAGLGLGAAHMTAGNRQSTLETLGGGAGAFVGGAGALVALGGVAGAGGLALHQYAKENSRVREAFRKDPSYITKYIDPDAYKKFAKKTANHSAALGTLKKAGLMVGVGAAVLGAGFAINRTSSSEVGLLDGRSTMDFALRTKMADKTQDFAGPEMAGAMNGQINGPMLFGQGTPRNYSLGATGDLALALHHKRHG